ncbi:Rmf/CrpP family protein [Pseudomonas sp. PGPPP4]
MSSPTAYVAVDACPYHHPALGTSWLRAYAHAQQQSFDF